uniref:Uncharacterized protein n=1 Tax=Parascaris equorum TaxID=6256 RepID=A0A914RTA2_PAREQ
MLCNFSNEDAKSAQLNVVDDDDLAFAEPAARRDVNAKKDRCTFCCKLHSESPSKPTSSSLADANTLLALSNVSLSNSQLPANISQSNQIVLNWLQAMNVNSSSNNGGTALPGGGSTNNNNKEEFTGEDDEMEETEASELQQNITKVTSLLFLYHYVLIFGDKHSYYSQVLPYEW